MGTAKKSLEALIEAKEKRLQRLENELKVCEERAAGIQKDKEKKQEAIRICEMERTVLLSKKLSRALHEKNLSLTAEVIDRLVSTLEEPEQGKKEAPSPKNSHKKEEPVLPSDDDKEFHVVRK